MSNWKKLTECEPEGEGPFLYFPTYICAGHSIGVCNKDWLMGCYNSHRNIMYWSYIEKPPGYKDHEDKRYQWDN